MMRAQNTLEGGGGRSKDKQNRQLRAFVLHFDIFVTFFWRNGYILPAVPEPLS